MTASRDEKIAPQLLPLWKLPKTSGLFTVLRSSVKSGSHVRRSSFSAIRFASDAVMALQLAPTPPTTTSTKGAVYGGSVAGGAVAGGSVGRRLGGRRLGGRRLGGRRLGGRRLRWPAAAVAGGSVAGGRRLVAGGWVAGGWVAGGLAGGWVAGGSVAGGWVAGGSVGSPSHTLWQHHEPPGTSYTMGLPAEPSPEHAFLQQ